MRGSFHFEAFNVSGLRLSFVIFEFSMPKIGSKALPPAIATGNLFYKARPPFGRRPKDCG